jgi:HK97 family phage major capsid protein
MPQVDTFFRLREINQALAGLNNKAKKEKRELTASEQREWDMLMGEYRDLQDEKTIAVTQVSRGMNTENFGFQRTGYKTEHKNLGQLIRDIRFPDLQKRDMNMSVGSSGGYLIPDQLLGSVISITPERSIVRSRATVIPADDEKPDAKIGIPTLDYDSDGDGGYLGGLTVYWLDENDDIPETEPKMQFLELDPHQVGAHTVVSNKLLRNDPDAANTFLNRIFREALFDEEDYQCLQGDGVGKPEGILNSDAVIEVTRDTASSFKWADVASMLSKFQYDGWSRSVWIINASVLSQLITMVDAGNNRVFVGADPSKGLPANLLGIPVLFTGRTPTLGTRGDVMLCDLSYYILKQGTGPLVMASEHPLIRKDQTVVVFNNFVDGAPWLKAPLPSRDGNTYSPFVVLK